MATPITTLFPVGSLPKCVSDCGPLFDVNGRCVPPATAAADAAVYQDCFCADNRLAAFSTTAAGVCDSACANAADLGSIQGWYSSFCLSVHNVAAAAVTVSSTSNSESTSSSSSSSSSGNDSWISTHWQWVLFLVIMVLGITGIWVGAAMWRKRYLARKERTLLLKGTLSPNTPGTGGSSATPFTPGTGGSASTPYTPGTATEKRSKWLR